MYQCLLIKKTILDNWRVSAKFKIKNRPKKIYFIMKHPRNIYLYLIRIVLFKKIMRIFKKTKIVYFKYKMNLTNFLFQLKIKMKIFMNY